MIDPLSALVTLMRLKQAQGKPPFVLLLGDGALPAGTPTLTDHLQNILSALGHTDVHHLMTDQLWARIKQIWPYLDVDQPTALLNQDDTPGPGHLALARLIAAGYFGIILTTALDRRLEKALEEIGFPADQAKIFQADQLSGKISAALQRAHPPVKLVKLHGSLTAERLRLSFAEAFHFDSGLQEELARLLSRDIVVVGHNPAYDEINRCFRSYRGTVFFIDPHISDPQEAFLGRLPQARPFNAIPAGCDDFFTRLAGRLLARPTPQVNVPHIHEICVTWTFPFFLPRFIPAGLRPCFADLPYLPQSGRLFLQRFGHLFDKGAHSSSRRVDWVPQDLNGAISGVPFYPLLVERSWGLSFVDPPEFRKHFGMQVRLRFHLYRQGIAVVALVARIHSRKKSGNLDRLIHLLKHFSPAGRHKEARFDAGPLGLRNAPISQIVQAAAQQLAEALYRPGQVPQPIPASHNGRVLHIYRATPSLTPERHAIPIFALYNLHSAWRDMDLSRVESKIASDFGWYKGDWNLVQGPQVLLYTPSKSKKRRARRLFMWKVIAAVELALGQELLLQRIPAEMRIAQQKSDRDYQEHLSTLAGDVQLFSRAALPSYQRKVFALVAKRLHLAEKRAQLEKSLAGLAKETKKQKLEQLLEGQARIRSSVDDLQEALWFRLDQQQNRLVTTIVQAINRKEVPGRELQPVMDSLQVLLEGLRAGTWALPGDALPVKAHRLAQIVDAPNFSIHHKLKITLPIIPLLLGYEGEVDLSSGVDLEQAWQRLQKGWQQLTKRIARNTPGRC